MPNSEFEKREIWVQRLLAKARDDTDILAVFLFGSVARNEQNQLSDTDLCLALTPRPFGFEGSALSGKRLDYLQDFPFDLQIFQQLPIYVRRRVLREGRVLFVRDEDLLYELAFRTAQAFEDFKGFYTDYLREVSLAGL